MIAIENLQKIFLINRAIIKGFSKDFSGLGKYMN